MMVQEDEPAVPATTFGFDNSFARLPDRFFARVTPTRVARPRLLKLNVGLAESLRLDPQWLAGPDGLAILAGNAVAQGSEPLAMAYAGHQFGHFVPQLGDGRANLLGEVFGRDSLRYDVQLKGSGPTPFSRRGDGRAAMGPALREYLVSEAMAALGVPTTRALAAVATGEPVYRETVVPGAVLTRIASSHLRVGTFQYLLGKDDRAGLRIMADYAIARHYPEIAESRTPYRQLLLQVIGRHAKLVAHWMLLGFIHGVMNTDNTSISGETIDYGPCAFMEAYEVNKVYSSIDRMGRYAFGNQPHAAHWNLARLAETLLPLMETEAGSPEVALAWAYEALESFGVQFEAARLAGLRKKLGLATDKPGDAELAEDLLQRMEAGKADFTLTFRRLADAVEGGSRATAVRELFAAPKAYDAWAIRWHERLAQEDVPADNRASSMRSVNPLFIPRNHLVEAALEAAVERDDLTPFEELLEVVLHPYDEVAASDRFTRPARTEECVQATFCGT